MANLNIHPKNAQKRVFKSDSSTGHAQFEFSKKSSQAYTNRNNRVLNIFYRLNYIS